MGPRQDGARIFAALAGQYDDPVLRLLSEAVTSGSRQHVLAVGAALRAAPRNFAWSHTDFVINACSGVALGSRYGLWGGRVRGMRLSARWLGSRLRVGYGESPDGPGPG